MTNKKKSVFSIIAASLAAQKERFGIIGIGLMSNALLDYSFDYMLYPYVVIKYGMLRGGLFMASLAIFICFILILLYDWSKKDWLGIEMLKEAREYHGSSRLRQWIAHIMKNHDWIAVIFLSIHFDPFITTAYMRKGINKFNGMGKRDWVIFVSSSLVSNAYWVVASFYGATVLVHFSNNMLEILGIAARVFVVLVVLTVILNRKLFFITNRLKRHFSFLEGEGKAKTLLKYVAESFAWTFFIYVVIKLNS